MPATRDGKLWRSQFYYKDWQGVRRKKRTNEVLRQKEKQMNGKETFFSNSRRIWISVLRIL